MKALLALLLLAAAASTPAADPPKVFRYAFEIAETSFDPHRISDVYSNIVNQGMFESPLTYDYLARPLKLKPQTVVSMPEISADGTTYTLRVKPGIWFTPEICISPSSRPSASNVLKIATVSRMPSSSEVFGIGPRSR